MSAPSPYCGRLDEHPPHEWIGWETWPLFPVVLGCPGAPVIEGGNPARKGKPWTSR